jgi:L-ascorbate metabolism protein UlaG (beta-lactamase superfamily)
MDFVSCVVYVDPYLSDHVASVEGPEMARQFPLPIRPEEVKDADWVLITHIHLDHCDLHTLVPMAQASASCRFVCPNECVAALRGAGIAEARLVTAPENWIPLDSRLKLICVPAAHPTIERDREGQLRFVGYVLEYDGRRLYHAGDTSPAPEMITKLESLAPIDTAFLPVNERNYYRESRGIIGNMTIREAFQLATDLKVRTLVPMHWDMFAPNGVYLEEIRLLHALMKPPFEMIIYPDRI